MHLRYPDAFGDAPGAIPMLGEVLDRSLSFSAGRFDWCPGEQSFHSGFINVGLPRDVAFDRTLLAPSLTFGWAAKFPFLPARWAGNDPVHVTSLPFRCRMPVPFALVGAHQPGVS